MLKYFDPDKWNIDTSNKIRFLLLVANVVFFYWLFTSFTWTGFGIGFIFYILYAKIGSDVGTHRYFCHRSFKAKPWAHWLFLLLSIPGPFGSIMHWTAAHRLHHEKSDTTEDPHSPHYTGAFSVWTFQLGNHWHINPKHIKDLLRDKQQLFLFKNYFKLYLGYIGLTLLIASFFGWEWIVYLWAMPITFVLHTTSAINVITHTYGYQSHNTGEKSTNNIWLNFLLWGNALHNNHHQNPASYTLAGDKWYEFDIWGWLIKKVLMDSTNVKAK